MELVVLSLHLIVCMCLIGLVLLQRSEGGALGMGGGGGGALMSGRGAADALAKMTSVAGGFFLVTSLSLTVLSGAAASTNRGGVFDLFRGEQTSPILAPPAATETPGEAPATEQTTTPDPTESRAPSGTQLASAILPGPASASAAEAPRAAPIENRPATNVPASATQRATTPPQSTTTRQPATTQPVTTPRQTPPQQATSTPANTQRAATGTTGTQPRTTLNATGARPNTTGNLTLPNTSGSGGLTAPDPNQTQPESIQAGNGVEAVRRERAGPDQ